MQISSTLRWHSVNDKLPENGQSVLVVHGDVVSEAYFHQPRKGGYICYFEYPNHGQRMFGFFEDVTYWAAMPEIKRKPF